MGIVEDTAALADDDDIDLFADTDIDDEDVDLDADDGTEVDEGDGSDDGEYEDDDEDPFADSDDDDDEPEPDGDDEPDLHTIKVDGETLEVSYDELVKLAQQGQDYTRKTQKLAEDRKRVETWEQLNQAFEADPEGTLRALAKQFDVDLAADKGDEVPEGWDPDDPVEAEVLSLRKELRELRAEREAEAAKRQEAEAAAQVAAQLDAVKTEFGVEFDDDELLQFAIDNQIGNVRAAYLAWDGSKAREGRTDRPQRQRKRTAPPVEGGRSRSKRLNKPGPKAAMSVEDAFEAALSQHRG